MIYNYYTRKYIYKILLSVFFSLIVAGSTSAIAWLLDPAIEKIFIENEAFYCDNLDLKVLPEELNNYYQVQYIVRSSKKKSYQKINLGFM